MKLFLLSRVDNPKLIYDCFDEKLVRAETERDARILANKESADEGEIWEDKTMVTAIEISVNGKPEIIISDFNAG